VITAEWDIPMTIQTPAGDLPFNQNVVIGTSPLDDLGYFMLVPEDCQAGIARRVTRTNLAQADGEITHRKFKTGYVVQLTAQLWKRIGADGEPACAGDLRAMIDYLGLILNSIDNEDGLLVWQPSERAGETILARELAQVRILGSSGEAQSNFTTVVVSKEAGSPLISVTFALICPLPYAQDAGIIQTALADGVPTTIHNVGNAPYYPVVWVNGPTNTFTLVNESNLDEQGNPLGITYDGTALPGGEAIASGHLVEFVFFNNSAYLDRNQDNLKPGINVPASDFWTLLPGANEIVLTGADGAIFWTSAYA